MAAAAAAAAATAAAAENGPVWSKEAIARAMAAYVSQALRQRAPDDEGTRATTGHSTDGTATAAAAAGVTVDEAAAVAAAAAAAAATAAVAAALIEDGAGVALLTAASLYPSAAAAAWDALTALVTCGTRGVVPALLRDGVAALRVVFQGDPRSAPTDAWEAALRTLVAVCRNPVGAVALDSCGAMRYAVAQLEGKQRVHTTPPALLRAAFEVVTALCRGLTTARRVPGWSELEVAAVASAAGWVLSLGARADVGLSGAAGKALAALAAWPRFAPLVAAAEVGRTIAALCGRSSLPLVAAVRVVPWGDSSLLPPSGCFNDETCVARMAARVLTTIGSAAVVSEGAVPAGVLAGILTHYPGSAAVLLAGLRATAACAGHFGDGREVALATAVVAALAPISVAAKGAGGGSQMVAAYLAALAEVMLSHKDTTPKKLGMGGEWWERLAALVQRYSGDRDVAVQGMRAINTAARQGIDYGIEICMSVVKAVVRSCSPADRDTLLPAACELLEIITSMSEYWRVSSAIRDYVDAILYSVDAVGPLLSSATVAAILPMAHNGDPLLAARVTGTLIHAYRGDLDIMHKFCCCVATTVLYNPDAGAAFTRAGCSTPLWGVLRDHGLHAAVVALGALTASLTPVELTPPGACRAVTAVHRSCTTDDKAFIPSAHLLGLQLEAWGHGVAKALPECDAADACRALVASAMAVPLKSSIVLPVVTAAKAWAACGTPTAAPDLCSLLLWRCVTLALAYRRYRERDYNTDGVVAAALELMVTLGPVAWETVPDTEAVATSSALLVAAVQYPDLEQVPAAVAVLQQLAAVSPAVRQHLWRVNAAVSLPALAGYVPADADNTEAPLPPPHTWHAAMQRMAAGAGGDPSPALVLLSSGVVLQAAVLQWLEPADARQLRVCHPAMAAAVAEHVWDATSRRNRITRGGGAAWSRAMPSAWTVRLPEDATTADMHALGAMRRLARVCIDGKAGVAVTALLPRTISTLHVSGVMAARSLAHLTALEMLIVHCGIAHKRLELPASLQHCHLLDGRGVEWHNLPTVPPLATLVFRSSTMSPVAVAALPRSLQSLGFTSIYELHAAGVSFAHLAALRHVALYSSDITDAVLATLPAALLTLDLSYCYRLTPAVSFRHLHALVALRAHGTSVSDDTLLTSMPPSVVLLNVRSCRRLTAAATCAALPALRHLNVSETDVGVAMLASLPAGLCDLDVSDCCNVDGTSRLSHLRCLRALACTGTGISNDTLASCPPTLRYLRAAGCRELTDALDLTHLPELAALVAWDTRVGDGMLRRLPPSLRRLELGGTALSTAAVLPPLPLLTCVDVSRTGVGALFLASMPSRVAHIDIERCPHLRGADTVAAWQSLIDSGTLDRLAECRASIDDLPPLVAATLPSRGAVFGRAVSHTCAAMFPAGLGPEVPRRAGDAKRDPCAPGFEDDSDNDGDDFEVA